MCFRAGAVSGSQVNHLRAKKGSMKLFHIILLSSAVAGSATMRSAASACENSIAIAVSLACQALGGSPADENRSRIDW